MINFKTYFSIIVLTIFYLVLISPVALAANLVIDKETGPSGTGLFHTPNYANDAACFQAALDKSKSGDSIIIRSGDYYLTKGIYQTNKNLNIKGNGKVVLHIQTPEKAINGIYFGGSLIKKTTLYNNAKKGSNQINIIDASQVQQNDLVKIWKNVQWCPLDYPDQMTGEIYAVKNVKGNVVTLNQPLLRDYRLSETVQIEVYRPIQVHFKNIRVEDTGATTIHHGLVMQYCKDSSVTESRFNNSGFGAICLYSCFNVTVKNNQIYNSLLNGSGYGVNAASGSAFINIEHNHIENCRHSVTGNSAEFKSLNRDVFIIDNTLIGANITGSAVVDAHADTINFVVTRNKIYPKLDTQLLKYYAFSDGTQQSIFSNNEIIGGYGGIYKRGAVNEGVHIVENNSFNGISGEIYQGGNGTDKTLIIRDNVQNNGTYGVYFPLQGSIGNIIISGNSFSNLSNQGVYQELLMNGVNLNIFKNTFKNIGREGIYIDGKYFKNNAVKIQNNILVNINTSNSSLGITVKNISNSTINGNRIIKVPDASFSASPVSGPAPLNVAFKDRSSGAPTSWRWNFGDGTSSTQKNPSHTYSKAGKYTVSLKVKNSAGSNNTTKFNFIVVTTLKPPVPAFSASPVNGKAPLTVKFTDKSSNYPSSWSWDFGDKSSSTVQSPSHKYSKAGKYSVKLTAKNSKGSNTAIKTNCITVK